jgi:hypothetical protein
VLLADIRRLPNDATLRSDDIADCVKTVKAVPEGATLAPMASRPSGKEIVCGYAGRTFSARGPFGPCPMVNVTASPSRSESNGVLAHAELWKKYSVPSGVAMKPKPLSVSRLMVPFDDMRSP